MKGDKFRAQVTKAQNDEKRRKQRTDAQNSSQYLKDIISDNLIN